MLTGRCEELANGCITLSPSVGALIIIIAAILVIAAVVIPLYDLVTTLLAGKGGK